MSENEDGIVVVRQALISVSDKQSLVGFAAELVSSGARILSTGGTAALLKASGIEVEQVSDYTGYPELMDGRLKTLHPKIHGGILARRDVDRDQMHTHDIQPIDLIVVNLYPFERVSANPDSSVETVVENIDIGGPAMIRAAAKNYNWTCVVTDSSDYADILQDIRCDGGIRFETRRKLAAKAYARTAEYDAAIARYVYGLTPDASKFPESLNLSFRKFMDMRYGENPHQSAAYYVPSGVADSLLSSARIHQGKPLSFNNVADVNSAYNCAREFDEPACVIIKHATPCGVASAPELASAYELAFRTDPTSAFGGVIALNRTLDESTAAQIVNNQFVEVILAPGVADGALTVLSSKQNIRVLEHTGSTSDQVPQPLLDSSCGGLLVQDPDTLVLEGETPRVVTRRAPKKKEMHDLLFAWKVAKHVKSNAIVYARDSATVGIGAGQMSRVDSATIASLKAQAAQLDVTGAVMASDAFFPFRDGIDTAAQAGVRAVIQPGGSMRDAEVIEAADEHGLAMLFTGMRHFRH